MQSSVHESSDATGKMEEISESSLLSWGSTNSDDVSGCPRVFTRLGDKYQANILPFKPPIIDCYQMGMTESINCKGNKDEDIEQQFAEGLPLPVMQISCFLPTIDVKEYDMTYVNGPYSDNELVQKEPLLIVAVKTENGLHHHDCFESADEGCAHILNDSIQFTEDRADSSVTCLITEISRAEDTCTDSTVTAENMPDAFYSRIGKRRKRDTVGWKRTKKIKVDLLDPRKQSSGSRHQSQCARMHSTGEDANSRRYIIVPGSPSAPWSKGEEDLFILGLYIFGKNFNVVKRFVETKEMGDILSYYYGIFFRTESYCRWAEFRKRRSRKCIQGQRIFSGWRQQELLARLLPHISEHSKHEVPEITKAFNEGRTSMEEFVTELKVLAGSEALVEAVGIGKGKQDLTTALIDPAKVNQLLSSHGKIPVGKACSSLSTEDIVKFLTGDFRLSKAQADDLFWEAVWPRLLARGWHSEQPDQVLFGPRQSLVFLIPGVQKFSRRKLTKGIHYFYSVSEVLHRMASDPGLLELERDEMRGVEEKTEVLYTSDSGKVENGHAGHSHSYLQPRFCQKQSDSLMFTVVDTSLISQGEQRPRIKRRVMLPLDDESEKFQNKSSETEDEDNLASHLTEQCQCPKHCVVGDSVNSNPKESVLIAINNENSDEKFGLLGMCKASNPDQDNLPSPLMQRILNTSSDCKDDTLDASLIESGSSKVQGGMFKFYSNEETSEAASDANSSEEKRTIISSSQCSLERSIGTNLLSRDSISAQNIKNTSQNSRRCRVTSEIALGLKLLQDQPENTAMNSILLMGSELLDGSKPEENLHYETSFGRPNEQPSKKSGVAKAASPGPEERKSSEPQENNESALLENVLNGRRQSTRVRPLTVRASDAFASGFFDTKRRKKGGGKTLNSDGYRTKSLSRLVGDELTSSFNA